VEVFEEAVEGEGERRVPLITTAKVVETAVAVSWRRLHSTDERSKEDENSASCCETVVSLSIRNVSTVGKKQSSVNHRRRRIGKAGAQLSLSPHTHA
jgi:hypothetical protein